MKYNTPENVMDLFVQFEQGVTFYSILDEMHEREMDNNQSMQLFLECIMADDHHIVEDSGTQVILQHDGYDHKLCVDSGGLGDFFSHGFEVSKAG